MKKRPFVDVVPKAGLEPARRVTTLDFESSASANSATSAYRAFLMGTNIILPEGLGSVKRFFCGFYNFFDTQREDKEEFHLSGRTFIILGRN